MHTIENPIVATSSFPFSLSKSLTTIIAPYSFLFQSKDKCTG